MSDLQNPYLKKTSSWLFLPKSPKFLHLGALNRSQNLQQALRSSLKSGWRGSHHAKFFKSNSAIAGTQVVTQS